jgi:hypothetical protein
MYIYKKIMSSKGQKHFSYPLPKSLLMNRPPKSLTGYLLQIHQSAQPSPSLTESQNSKAFNFLQKRKSFIFTHPLIESEKRRGKTTQANHASFKDSNPKLPRQSRAPWLASN